MAHHRKRDHLLSSKNIKKIPKHSRVIAGKRHIWYVPNLWACSKHLPVIEIDVESIGALDIDCWFHPGTEPTIRNVAQHCQRIIEANLEYPIILHADGSLMDGGHRVAKALIQNIKKVKAVRFDITPEPDEICDV